MTLHEAKTMDRLGVLLLRGLATAAATLAVTLVQTPGRAQFIDCPFAEDLLKIPELVSSPTDRRLRGTMLLSDEQQYIPFRPGGSKPGTKPNTKGEVPNDRCAPQHVRIFRGIGAEPTPATPTGDYPFPLPGPTLRARVGDIIELTFLNQIDVGRFPYSLDRGELGLGSGCDDTGGFASGQPGYPQNVGDTYPDCFHGSSTGNIHFHGTHTNPNTTGDNVFIEVRPGRIKGQVVADADSVKPSFEKFFADCEARLKGNPISQWPTRWTDLPEPYRNEQERLLKLYDSDPQVAEKLWPVNAQQIANGDWPQYYIGAFPYCFQLPEYVDQKWPQTAAADHDTSHRGYPPPQPSLRMGQSPGTHWYHAHKHGSTTINVSNGMTGAFIIEGQYDDELNQFYGPGWTQTQPVMVINQLGVSPNLQRGSSGRLDKGPDFSVNGRLQPVVTMRPGEVQMWRMVNTSSRAGTFFANLPDGFEWRQLAQDGVQFKDVNYFKSHNKPFKMASGNRVDMLVKAPATASPDPYYVEVRNFVDPGDLTSAVLVPLIRVKVAGEPMTGPQSHFADKPRHFPAFLTDITRDEVKGTKRIVFSSTSPPAAQHTIDGRKFDGTVGATVQLNTVEEWTIVNTTQGISHPFHIHINPFQVVEVFDPNAPLLNPKTGKPIIDPQTNAPYPLYVFNAPAQTYDGATQCSLDTTKAPDTWKPCDIGPQANLIWWDVFPIPSAQVVNAPSGQVTVPGYFKMRSRFVDFSGYYVMHCHILAHEDRGMMTVVQVSPFRPPVLHR